jgi:hypothetical protein
MKRKLMELVLAAASFSLLGAPAYAQAPPADSQPPADTAAKPESNTGPIRIGAGVALVVILGVLIMRRKSKKKTDEEF